MTFETAIRINSAASWIGLALMGVLKSVDREHIDVVRCVSLAQLQTAKDIAEAYNAQPCPHPILCACEDALLVKVKEAADAAAG